MCIHHACPTAADGRMLVRMAHSHTESASVRLWIQSPFWQICVGPANTATLNEMKKTACLFNLFVLVQNCTTVNIKSAVKDSTGAAQVNVCSSTTMKTLHVCPLLGGKNIQEKLRPATNLLTPSITSSHSDIQSKYNFQHCYIPPNAIKGSAC